MPATTSITLKRDQEILAGDWYACYESIKKGKALASEAVAATSSGCLLTVRSRRWNFSAMFFWECSDFVLLVSFEFQRCAVS